MLLPFIPSKVVATFVLLTVVTTPVSSVYIAINPERLQLMKDALSWMNFRLEGNLATADDYEKDLLHMIKRKYGDSKHYRTFVIAFHQGVLPKLTLQENQACDPSYVWKYKHPSNNMVTWYGMKKFTYESYQKRDDPSIQYCDYRQGLVCNPITSKCECAEGSSMTPVSPGSTVQRCMLDKGEVCALPDLDQGAGTDYFQNDVVTSMIFNLEKPLACKQGTQCRVDNTDLYFSRCHDSNTDPSKWIYKKDHQHLRVNTGLGRECSLGNPSHQGRCDTKDARNEKVGSAPGYYCYNFGPPRNGTKNKVNRLGFCADKLGSWQIKYLWASQGEESYSKLWDALFIMAFVHRRSVPLSADELKAYYQRYIAELFSKIFPTADSDNARNDTQFQVLSGEVCNVAKTKKMEDIWKYYMGLEDDPPPGKEFVDSATKKELDAKLQEMIDLANLNDGKMCKVYWSFYRRRYEDQNTPLPPLRCVTSGTPVGNNDGRCQVVNDDSTKPFAEKVQQLADFSWDAVKDANDEKDGRNVDTAMLIANPEPECTPTKALLARNLDTLEGGSCPKDSICIENYEDEQGIYDGSCNLKSGVKLRYDCQDISGGGNPGRCEGQMLDKKIAEEVGKIGTLPNLGRGDKCRHALEKEIRDGIGSGQWSGNKYKMLAKVTKEVKPGTKNFCDRTRLLECTDKDICKCVDKTEPRMITIKGGPSFGSSGSVSLDAGNDVDTVYQSDYCYLKEGSCTGLQDLLDGLPLTQTEIDKIWEHYGQSDSSCMKGNTCVYVDLETQNCTTDNTGKTGHDLKPRPTTTKRPVSPGEPLRPPNPFGGAEGNWNKFGILGWSLAVCSLLVHM